jgi:hypothetical protein
MRTTFAEDHAPRGAALGPAAGGVVRAVALLVVGASAALAAAPLEPPQAEAVRAEQAPEIDGDVLDDPAWSGVEPLTDFWQTAPDAGSPASQPTEVRILYTETMLYFGVVCYDDDPSGIIVNESRRDSSLEDTDSFQVVLDTYLDRQNGFVFGTNPTGLEYDGQVTNEGEGGRGLGSSLGGLNLNWNGTWEVETAVGDFGWSAEFAIPFSTLRYDRGTTGVWGMNFQRNIRRRNEQAYWSPLARQFNLLRLSSAGTLDGLEPPRQRNLQLLPYVRGDAVEAPAVGRARPTDADVGGDLKWSVTPSLTLDGTVNTDFAQVEVDEQQINLDRFNLFFPEKRPFFLENAGFFTMGDPGEVEMFFSRRIGIGPEGEVVPILAGGRLSGKGGGFNIGVLNMQTRAVHDVVPANNFTVARLSRELPNRSRLGAIFVNRAATGETLPSDVDNQTVGADGQWGIGRYSAISGYVAKTFTPGLSGRDHALSIKANHDSPTWLLEAGYTEVGEDFNPTVGFLERHNYRSPSGLILYRYRPDDLLGLLELRPHVSYTGFWKPDGFQESGRLHIDNHAQWRSGWEVHTGLNFTHEGVIVPFEIYPGVTVPRGRYEHAEAQLVLMTDQGAPLSLDSRVFVGGFFGGSRFSLEAGMRGRIGDSFNAYIDYQRNDVSLPGGDFVTNLLRMRFSYSFTTRLYLQALVQYNDLIDNWSTNLRFGWLQAANSGFYLVYNENRDPRDLGVGLRDRSVIVKYSHTFDLLD